MELSVTEKMALTLVVAPAAIVLVITVLVYAGSGRRGGKRYRPGRPFEFTPVWFLSAPEPASGPGGASALPHGPRPAELPAGRPAGGPAEGPLLAARSPQPASPGATGGASDRW
jgi:hypothetical protein